VPDLCREHGISTATFYKWRSKYGGMDASMVSQMKALEEENRRLKRMYAELSMQADLDLWRIYVASTAHLGCLAFKGQGAFASQS
jgi:transposase-like protein